MICGAVGYALMVRGSFLFARVSLKQLGHVGQCGSARTTAAVIVPDQIRWLIHIGQDRPLDSFSDLPLTASQHKYPLHNYD
jgi:hypothetical protein